MLDNILKNLDKCYGCAACTYICPTNAIEMQYNEEGFLYPIVDEEKCISCSKCIEKCIVYNETNTDVKSVLACSALDNSIVQESTSGGIAYILAEHLLKDGGIAYGAAFSTDKMVKHIRIEHIGELKHIQGTKYVQSNIESVYVLLQDDISKGKEILFSGTPCQIAAIKRVFGYYEKLFLLEIVCMGCPSPLVWRDYIKQKEAEWGNIECVKFRDKSIGWKKTNISYYINNKKVSFEASMDEYLMGFGQCLYLRTSCHDCAYKGKRTLGDIKIGDFWGIENSNVSYNTNGTSVVIIETEVGEQLINRVRNKLLTKYMDYRFAVSSNPCIEISKAPSKNRIAFFKEYEAGSPTVCELIRDNLIYAHNYDRMLCQYPAIEGLLRGTINNTLVDFFDRNHYKKVAVYGMSELGLLFIDLLLKNEIIPVCIIDKNSSRYEAYKGIPVIGPYQIDDSYDCIIVTVMHLYNNVLETLMAQGVDLDKVISLGSVV